MTLQKLDPGTSEAQTHASIPDQLDLIERKLAQMQRLVTVGTLAAGAVHEINNLLTPALSYAHLACTNRQDPATLAKALEKIVSGVESACEVAQAMLNYSRDRDEAAVSDVSQTLDAAIGCLARDPARDGVHIVRRIAPATRVRIKPITLQQVLLNLILNAREALKGRGGTIAIEARRDADDVSIVVSDDGPGVPAEIVENIFEPFVTTNSAGASTVGGAGLGLAINRYLLERAKGSIELERAGGPGACFRIRLAAA